ncbi:MAG: hypothetical protein ACXVP1_00495 [Thermoleophilia bacterium]
MDLDLVELKASVLQVATLAAVELSPADVYLELLPAPHRPPPALPQDTQAVFAFLLGDGCLKVGKAGPRTEARFTSQPYGFGAPSTLAKSLVRYHHLAAMLLSPDRADELAELTEASVGAWLRHNTSRLHLLMPALAGGLVLTLMEGFMQCRLQPVFEGRST